METTNLILKQERRTMQNLIDEFPLSSYRMETKKLGHGKGYRDYFGRTVSEFNRVLQTKDAKDREKIPVTLKEQIQFAKESQAREKHKKEIELAAEKRKLPETRIY